MEGNIHTMMVVVMMMMGMVMMRRMGMNMEMIMRMMMLMMMQDDYDDGDASTYLNILLPHGGKHSHDDDGDIYIMMQCLSVCNENEHFLLGVSCNHLNPL